MGGSRKPNRRNRVKMTKEGPRRWKVTSSAFQRDICPRFRHFPVTSLEKQRPLRADSKALCCTTPTCLSHPIPRLREHVEKDRNEDVQAASGKTMTNVHVVGRWSTTCCCSFAMSCLCALFVSSSVDAGGLRVLTFESDRAL